MVRNDIKNSSLLKTKFLIYAFNGRTTKRVLTVLNLLSKLDKIHYAVNSCE